MNELQNFSSFSVHLWPSAPMLGGVKDKATKTTNTYHEEISTQERQRPSRRSHRQKRHRSPFARRRLPRNLDQMRRAQGQGAGCAGRRVGLDQDEENRRWHGIDAIRALARIPRHQGPCENRQGDEAREGCAQARQARETGTPPGCAPRSEAARCARRCAHRLSSPCPSKKRPAVALCDGGLFVT